MPNLYTLDKKLSKWVYTPLKVGFLLTVVTNFPFFRNTSKSKNDNFTFFSCSKEKDMFG